MSTGVTSRKRERIEKREHAQVVTGLGNINWQKKQ